MRIAVTGTHCCGKTTLVDEFLRLHPDFNHEPEPYSVLEEDYGQMFAAEPSPEDFFQQLEFNISRLRYYQAGARVIFERSPIDFLAYMLALYDMRRSEGTRWLIDRSVDMLKDAIQLLDLIVFLPLSEKDGISMSDSENPELRSAVDCRLVSILNDHDFNLLTTDRPLIVEAMGSTAERMRALESALTESM